MASFYRDSVARFLATGTDEIVGRLSSQTADAGFYQQKSKQIDAWREQVELMRNAFRILQDRPDFICWSVLLEYPIPRRGKRIDAVLLANGLILVLEFKCGAAMYSRDALVQAEDYCLDLRDFHKQSHRRCLIPFLVATKAPTVANALTPASAHVAPVVLTNAAQVSHDISSVLSTYASYACSDIDAQAWDHSDYLPTPTIIESARHLYAGQNVREISRCHGGAENLTKTTDAVLHAIRQTREQRTKTICFITGVPGAGKTLAGLNIVHNHKLHDGDLGCFLSGNGPLVKVLTEALTRDHAKRTCTPVKQARGKVRTFIQNVHHFIDAYWEEPDKVPPDKVVVFDEAQRAWNAEQSKRKFKRPFSEPELMLRIMDRHTDWAVVVALIGGGQEINSGEAGLSEWGRTITSKFPHWQVLVSPLLKSGRYAGNDGLFETVPANVAIREDAALHLNVSLRSYRAEALSSWVEAVLDQQPEVAAQISASLQDYPIALTRSLDRARKWLHERQRGSRRTGLIASSGARRLRALGLDVTAELSVEEWFLNPRWDVRSSYYLETVATEFGIQGLELDWTAVAWASDLVPKNGHWKCQAFRGTEWQNVNDTTRRQYIINKYRVLLTRAREGMVICVPPGDPDDRTRPAAWSDLTYRYLARCGIAAVLE